MKYPETFKEWFVKNLAEDCGRDIANHGADAGYPYITYTRDTVKLFDRYADDIWNMAVDCSEQMGCKNVADMIAQFRRQDMLADIDQFKNLMVWFACEELSRELEDA